MNRPEPSSRAPRPEPASAPPPAGVRPPRAPLTPARTAGSVGQETDPELDVAPNLGGEQQMQDA